MPLYPPDPVRRGSSSPIPAIKREFFALDYTAGLNLVFIALSAAFVAWRWRAEAQSSGRGEPILFGLACLAYVWLAVGLALPFLAGIT